MDKRELKSIIEALLFIWGDPLSIHDIKDVLGIKKEEVEALITEMKDEFNYSRRGVQIIEIRDNYQISTRPEHYEWISKLCSPRASKSLSSAALETLSIISYKQPITKMEIEALRGVKCDRALKTLLEKRLVEEVGRLERTGRPILYGTTDEFLRYFGLKTLEELPSLKKDEDIDLELEE